MKKTFNTAFSKMLSLVLVVALMLTTVLSAGVIASADSSVVSAKALIDFEGGAVPSNITGSGFAISSDVARGGYSLAHMSGDSNVKWFLNDYGFAAGKTYIISGEYYVSSAVAESVTEAAYAWFNLSENNTTSIETKAGGSLDTWLTFEIEYNCSADNASINFMVLAKDTIYFDNIHIYEKGAYDSDKLPLVTDLSNITTAGTVPVLTKGNVTVTYQQDADEGTVAAIGNISKGYNSTNEVFIPYNLKANTTYSLQIKYKLPAAVGSGGAWTRIRVNGAEITSPVLDSTAWVTYSTTFTTNATADQKVIFSSTTGGALWISSIILKEVKATTNTAEYQAYDFDNIDFSANALNSQLPSLAIVGDTLAYDFTLGDVTSRQSNGKLDAALVAGNVYKLSYDYKGAGAVRFIPNNGAWANNMYSVEQTMNNYGSNLTLAQSDSWTTHTTVFVAQANSTHLFMVNYGTAELYIDNVIIEDVSSQYNLDKYVNDFEGAENQNLIEQTPANTDVTYETDEEYGTVAKITFSAYAANHRVRIPVFTLVPGETYRIKVTYKSEGWIANAYTYNALDGSYGYGASGETWDEWVEQYFYYTPTTYDSFGFGTVTAEVPATLWLAEVEIEKVSGVLGDLDNSTEVDPYDLILMKKWLIGSIGGYDMFDYAVDVTEDGKVDIIDFIRIKRILVGLGAPTTVIVDECTNDAELYSSASNIYKNDNNASFSDTTRYRVHTLGTESNIIYYAKTGLDEAVIGFDREEDLAVDMTVYVSDDQSVWTQVEAATVTTKPEYTGDWISGTKYYDDLSGKYLKIVLPDTYNFAINKVYINGLDSDALSAAGAQNFALRDAATIYVSNDGNDANDGLTVDTPKATLSAATSMALVPGDTIALNSGDTFDGGAVLTASGTENAPIKITSYGEGDKPVITNFAGDSYMTGCGLFVTGEYVEISNLAFTDENGYSALDFYAYEAGATKGIKVENCYFYDINHTTMATEDDTGAIHFVAKGATPAWFDGVTVQNNSFEAVARTAVFFNSEWTAIDKSQTWGNRNLTYGDGSAYLAENILVKGNTINNNGGDAIMLIGTKDALIEYNVVSNSHLMLDLGSEKSFANIWCHSSIGCVMQYNEVYGTTGENHGNDLNAFDIDLACDGCIVQYNYTHDNAGASVIVCGTNNTEGSTVTNSVIRYNISVNDGLADARSSIDLSAGIDGVLIHNNTIIAKDTDRLFTIADYCNDGEYVAPANVEFYNNLFYGANSDTSAITYGGDWNLEGLLTVKFYNNVFRSVDNLPWDTAYDNKWTAEDIDNITTTDILLKGVEEFINNTTITNGIDSVCNTFMPVQESILLTDGYDMSTVYSGFTAVDYAGNEYDGNLIGALDYSEVVVYHDILTTGNHGALECTYSRSGATGLAASVVGTAGYYLLSTADGKHVTWAQDNMQSFWIDGFISESGKANINNYYILQASSDNATWTDLTYTVTYSAGGSHQKCRLMVSNLPEGTKYVKLTKANGNGSWEKGSVIGVGYTYSK